MRKNFWISSLTIFSILFNCILAPAQNRKINQPKENNLIPNVELSAGENSSEIFSQLNGSGNFVFESVLRKIAGAESDAADALNAQSVYFFERFRAATGDQLVKTVEKARAAGEEKFEAMKKNPNKPAGKSKPRNSPKTYGNGFLSSPSENETNRNSSDVKFLNAAYSPKNSNNPKSFFSDSPELTVVENENGISATATETKTLDMDQVSATRTATNESKAFFDGNTMHSETNISEKVEAVSKTDGGKVTKESKISTAASFDVCPDAQGIVRGTGKTKIFKQTTTVKGKEIAALTDEYEINFQITGFVNDAAEFTHFDMTGTATEKRLGYDRAVRVGILEDANGLTDGTKSISYQIGKSSPPGETRDESGYSRFRSAEFGKIDVKLSGINTTDEATRIAEIGKYGISGFMLELEPLMRSSVSRWRNYECVAVECTAPKNSLGSKESVKVTSVSLSKLDSSKFGAAMKAVGSEAVTPENQAGKPTAEYTLTAPQTDKAEIVVTSTSKRGIGIGSLEIPVNLAIVKPPVKKPPVKKPPVSKPKDCDQGWTGTVKAVRTKLKTKNGKPSGGLIRQVESVNENYSVQINALGTRDTTGGIVNNFHGNAEVAYHLNDYCESNYASGKMSCDKRIIESPETKKMEMQTKGDTKGQILVTISVIGSWGHIDFSPPQLKAERIITHTYESACPSYNAVNSGTKRGDYLVDVVQTGFEVEFDVDPSKPNVIQGSKTIQESDGSETTYTWNLIRCN